MYSRTIPAVVDFVAQATEKLLPESVQGDVELPASNFTGYVTTHIRVHEPTFFTVSN